MMRMRQLQELGPLLCVQSGNMLRGSRCAAGYQTELEESFDMLLFVCDS